MLLEEMKFPMLLTNSVAVVVCATGKGDRFNTFKGEVLAAAGNSGYKKGMKIEGFSLRFWSPFKGSIYVDGVSLQNI